MTALKVWAHLAQVGNVNSRPVNAGAVEQKARRCPRNYSDDYLGISSMAGVTHGVIPRLELISLLFGQGVLGQEQNSLLCPVQGGRNCWDFARIFL